ncbi:TatD family hydrolase [Adlercreutzia sp. ZJ138]|uniref:TatD family hydrolase n=1 Tax=Adlercreutzia sp. ZJ138 TaxID=2709405 RepID=UPI0013ECF67D|nr:TatD family hydrolase [Adlercreutzia sp. ZJ138]
MILDAHCHLGFAVDVVRAADDLAACGVRCFSNTVEPAEYERLIEELGAHSNVRVGVGLHPWWVLDGTCGEDDMMRFEHVVQRARFVGEIGLDFGKRFDQATPARQRLMTLAFDRAVAACAKPCAEGGCRRAVSLHSVRAASHVLDELERTGCASSQVCILHWFSGTSDELHRAKQMGCWFSVSMRMLETRRGREYVKAMPLDHLLLETDEPAAPGAQLNARCHANTLALTASEIARVRGCDEQAVLATTRAFEREFFKLID